MNWDAIGAISEMVGAVAVVISLIYLAIQIRSSTEATRTSTYQSVVSEFGHVNNVMAGSRGLSGLFARAMEEFETLDAEDKARVSQLFFVTFHNFENMYYQYLKGYLEEEVWIGWRRLMLTYHARPGFQLWWSIRSDVFSKSFVDFLATEENDIDVVSYYDVTKAAIEG
jgi:hypothetical protein